MSNYERSKNLDMVSIVIPVYNAGQYLRRCIQSILDQTYDNFEIILVNDSSTDDSQLIIDEFVQRMPNHITSLIQPNAGQSVARNVGVSHARGEYLFFVDADDWLHKNTLELLYYSIKRYNLDIVVCGINFFRTNTPEQGDFIALFRENKYLPSKFCWGKLIKLSYWLEHNFKFVEGIFYEDLELMPKVLFQTSKISIVETPLYNYELRNQLSTTSTQKKEYYIFDIINRLLDFYHDKQQDPQYEQFMLSTIILTFLEFYHKNNNHEKLQSIFQKASYLITLKNTRNLNQKMIVILYKAGISLQLVHVIVRLRQKILRFIV